MFCLHFLLVLLSCHFSQHSTVAILQGQHDILVCLLKFLFLDLNVEVYVGRESGSLWIFMRYSDWWWIMFQSQPEVVRKVIFSRNTLEVACVSTAPYVRFFPTVSFFYHPYLGKKNQRDVAARIVSNNDSLFDSTNSGDSRRAHFRYVMTQRLHREETFDQGHGRGHSTSSSWCPGTTDIFYHSCPVLLRTRIWRKKTVHWIESRSIIDQVGWKTRVGTAKTKPWSERKRTRSWNSSFQFG